MTKLLCLVAFTSTVFSLLGYNAFLTVTADEQRLLFKKRHDKSCNVSWLSFTRMKDLYSKLVYTAMSILSNNS